MVDAVGTNNYTYTTGGQLLTDDGPFASDTLTNTYVNRQRTLFVLGQPTGTWTNAFGYDEAGRMATNTSPAGQFLYAYDPQHPSEVIGQVIGAGMQIFP